MSELIACSVCGSLHPAEELTELGNARLCSVCLATETVICSVCGERIWEDDDAGDARTHLCQICYDRYYTSCVRCHSVIHVDEAYYEDDDGYDALCHDCFQRRGGKCIHDYYYKPEPRFLGEGSRFYGIELEIDDGGESNVNAAKLLDIANGDAERLYIKHDGSLNDGMELVSHPATLDYHLKEVWLK